MGRAVTVRLERVADVSAIRDLNAAAFGRPEEATLVDALRDAGALALSCVADLDRRIVGHLALSPVEVRGVATSRRIAGLGPMAVVPARQRSGIGAALVAVAIARAREDGWAAIVVLGHPAYYPRFGFRRASSFGLACEYDAPDDAFMALELVPRGLAGSAGTIVYHAAFGAL